ncbi:MAG: response regulator [Leadbetterella sp.]|nr:response regulator [Leadbetterella sp.]
MKIRVLIVDDETNSREVLSNLLLKHTIDIEIIGEASNVDEAYEMCCKLLPDLIFLDIQMPRSNGFNLLKKFKEIAFEVIFVTSFDHFAITAIKFNALDYLLKPVEIIELTSAVEKAKVNIRRKNNQNLQYINLLYDLENDIQEKKFAIHTGEKVRMINSSEVIFIEGDGRYSIIYMVSNELLTTPKNLKEFEDFFGSKSKFIRISKSILINSTHIKEYQKGDPFIIKMVNDKIFEASRRRKTDVLEKLLLIK